MADEDWGDVQVTPNVDSAPLQVAAELPEVKLFGRWSCDDVEVSDMSLQVCFCLLRCHYSSCYLKIIFSLLLFISFILYLTNYYFKFDRITLLSKKSMPSMYLILLDVMQLNVSVRLNVQLLNV